MSCCPKSIDGKRTFENISVGDEGIEFASEPGTKIQRRSSDGCVVHSVNNVDVMEVCETKVDISQPLTVTGNITTSTGDVVADIGNIVSTTGGVSAETGILVNNGNIVSTNGDIIAGLINLQNDGDVSCIRILMANGTVLQPSLTFLTALQSGLYLNGDGSIGLGIVGDERVKVSASRTEFEDELRVCSGGSDCARLHIPAANWISLTGISSGDTLQVKGAADLDIVCDYPGNTPGASINFRSGGSEGSGDLIMNIRKDDTGTAGPDGRIIGSRPFQLPSYATGSLPTGETGDMAFDTTLGQMVYYNGSSWIAV